MDPFPELFDKQEMDGRIDHLIKELKEIETSFIFNRADLMYYSSMGLDGMIEVNVSARRFVKRNIELANQLSAMDIYNMPSFRIFKEIAKESKVNNIGLELDILPYKTVDYIKKAFGGVEIFDISLILRKIRSVKSSKEQEYMRQAAKQTDESFEMIEDKIKPGVSELELSIEIENFLRSQGHPGHIQIRSFQHNYTTSSYVMTGESTRHLNSLFGPVSGTGLCRYHLSGPSKRKIKNNDAVLIDTTGNVEGYTADETITFFVGKPDNILLDAYEVAKDVHQFAENNLVEGRFANEIFDDMVQIVSESGMAKNFMGINGDTVAFIGHGIGLELDEFPLVAPSYRDRLHKGNVIALEPKLIFDKPATGVGIEQDYIVGTSKAERITRFPF